jgi:hypothetical protein
VFELVALLAGAVTGFVGSRLLRRPSAVAVASRASAPSAPRPPSSADLRHAAVNAVVTAAQAHTRDPRSPLPGAYVLRLHPRDLGLVGDAPGSFAQRVEEAFEQWAHGHGLALAARPSVSLRQDPGLVPGRPRAEVAARPGPAAPPARPAPPPAPASVAASVPAVAALVPAERDRRPHELRGDAVVIGRSSAAAIRVDDGRVSRTHATLRRGDDGWTVTDERSSNGTRINGRAVPPDEPTPLRDGDELDIGPATFTYRASRQDPDVTRAVDLGDPDPRP